MRAVRRSAAPPWVHGVHLYDRDTDLVRALVDYLTDGWAADGVAIVVATAEHRAALRDELARRSLSAALRGGRLIELDATDTLALFMRDGHPDRELFHETVGALVREHGAGVPLRAFGEMVDVLWAAGAAAAALELEWLWKELQHQVPFSLLCGYAAAHLDDAGRQAVCAAHDHRAA